MPENEPGKRVQNILCLQIRAGASNKSEQSLPPNPESTNLYFVCGAIAIRPGRPTTRWATGQFPLRNFRKEFESSKNVSGVR